MLSANEAVRILSDLLAAAHTADPNAPPPEKRACCYVVNEVYYCRDLTEAECSSLKGTWDPKDTCPTSQVCKNCGASPNPNPQIGQT